VVDLAEDYAAIEVEGAEIVRARREPGRPAVRTVTERIEGSRYLGPLRISASS